MKKKNTLGIVYFLIGLAALWMQSTLYAQTPTPEQLRQLEQLTPAQRTELMRALGGESSTVVQQQRPEPTVVAPREEGLAVTKEPESASPLLKRFGYDLFVGGATTFAPAADIPIPVDYIIGPGDTIELQLFGSQNAFYSLVVTREGVLHFPELGPITVSGLQFSDLRGTLQQRVSEQMIGVRASITMGRLRSIRIFILGDAHRPGSYTISALSTMTNALLVSGGINPIGSLRNVQLKRNGRLIQTLDLYDLLLRGDTSADTRVQPGDVIFIPPVGRTVGVDGEVRRPAIYELRAEKTVDDVLVLAGGLLPTAYPQASQIERINDKRERTIIDVDLTIPEGLASTLSAGDTIRVYSILEKREDIVLLSGHVYRGGSFQWHTGMRLTDLISSQQELLPNADLDYVVVRREIPPDRRIEVFSTGLGAALAEPGSNVDILLKPRDQVIVFSQSQDRVSAISTLIAELRQQGSFYEPDKVVSIYGHVRFPGEYPLEISMRAKDLLRAAGAVLPDADLEYGLLVREKEYGGDIEVFHLDPGDLLQDAGADDMVLIPRDQLWFFRDGEDKQERIAGVLSRLSEQAESGQPAQLISIGGQVTDPGQYPLVHEMRISGLIRAAGGLEEPAYTLASELTRYKVEDNERREAVVVDVDLGRLRVGNLQADLMLQPQDFLNIKPISQWQEQGAVLIEGEVLFPGEYTIQRGERLSSVLQRAGGLSDLAFTAGAVFLRTELREREQQQLDEAAMRLQSEAIRGGLFEGNELEDLESRVARQELIDKLSAAVATGRLVIDVQQILNDPTNYEINIALENGDRLLIPRQAHTVTIIGEVQFPTSHVYQSNVSRNQYIDKSGGPTQNADEKRIYIVRAGGEVVAGTGSRFFRGRGARNVQAGDTIVVPMNTDRLNQLTLWTNVTTMIYNVGVAAAAVGSF